MRWALDAEQLMFQEAIADWLGSVADPATVRRQLDSGDPGDFEARLATEGWLSVGLSEERGGQGGGLLELALAAEQFARHAAPSSAWLATVLAFPALDDRAIEEVLEGGLFAAPLVSSTDPVLAPSSLTVAGGTVSGEVHLVLGADRAQLLVLATEDAFGIVRADSAGVRITPRALLDRSRTAADVALDAVPFRSLEGNPVDYLERAALRGAVLVAADSLGAATRMLELAVEYSGQRTQFGVPIGSFQAMKHAAATMLVAQEASRSLAYYAASSVDEELDDHDLHAAAAKAQVTRAGDEAAEGALTMHGAIGYTWEHDLQLLYKRAKLDLALFGSPTVWNERIADRLALVPA
jgi:alkylation response protein AidB-like acyl-CoA dehydrogenase